MIQLSRFLNLPIFVIFRTQGLRDKTLAGKKAVFDVTIKESNIRTVPEINDELAAKIRPGLDAEGLIQEVCKSIIFLVNVFFN
jgi:FKBP-type peptidyl-prolyl cis-trans isomerase (trigger factor)